MLLERSSASIFLLVALLAADGDAQQAERIRAGQEQKKVVERKLTGKFLQVTDFHPDPYYSIYSSTEKDNACHSSRGHAGYYGAETTSCDSPLTLVNATFDWIAENIRDEIDFVVWTGDSARHDNDEEIPRSQEQVVSQNEFLVQKVREVFERDDNDDDDPTNDLVIPVVPTLGNNDILPHNIFRPGPNRWTNQYLKTWRNFIPEHQRHQFQRGGWYSVEVIPGKLAVFSLNTLYFFNSNSAVDGCANPDMPGFEQMEWLRIQLEFCRSRGVKALMIGHVPPARTKGKVSWDETCWQKYTLWMRQFRDVVSGSLWGHMNIDHFMLQDFDDLRGQTLRGKMGEMEPKHLTQGISAVGDDDDDGLITIESASDYLEDLHDVWSDLPKPPKSLDVDGESTSFWDRLAGILKRKHKSKDKRKKFYDRIGGEFAERFSLALVSSSIVPNYFPSIRIFEYNITGLEDHSPRGWQNSESSDIGQDEVSDTTLMRPSYWRYADINEDDDSDPIEVQKKKKWRFTIPSSPSKSAPPGPAYSPQPLSLVGYSQLFANLTKLNNDFTSSHLSTGLFSDSQQELSLFKQEADRRVSDESVGQLKWKEGKHIDLPPPGFDEDGSEGKKPKPKPKDFEFEIEYNTRDRKDLFGLQNFHIRGFVELAGRMGRANKSPFALDDVDTEKKKKKKKKHKKKKKKKKKKNNKLWREFLRRAFVSSMDEEELDDRFGFTNSEETASDETSFTYQDEALEL